MRIIRIILCILVLKVLVVNLIAQRKLIVSPSFPNSFKSIQAAINSIAPNNKTPIIIEIKNGVYKEKIYLKNSYLIFRGESREQTIIQQTIARDEWRCSNPSDWGVATINVDSCSDIQFENLTVINDYGKVNTSSKTIACVNDTSGKKLISITSHQMAFRSFAATRLQFKHCRFVAYGGDTMSPWNTSDGMFYFNDCIIEGGVDLFCPRGWSLAENCIFIANTGPAIIWHDGSVHESSKTVLSNCRFEGYDGFKLGRYHRDAQFYLMNCSFAANMADQDIYLVPTTNTILWGRRVYYYNCRKDGIAYNWYANNVLNSKLPIEPNKINASWVFENKWTPSMN
jgi:pectinesterase